MRLREFMRTPVFACIPTTTLANAARAMEINNVGSLVVTDVHERAVGVVTDRDLALSLAHGSDANTAVEEIMSRHVVTVAADASLDDAAGLMDSHAVRRLPVVDAEGRPIGIVSLDDLYGYLVDETITLRGAVRSQHAAGA